MYMTPSPSETLLDYRLRRPGPRARDSDLVPASATVTAWDLAPACNPAPATVTVPTFVFIPASETASACATATVCIPSPVPLAAPAPIPDAACADALAPARAEALARATATARASAPVPRPSPTLASTVAAKDHVLALAHAAATTRAHGPATATAKARALAPATAAAIDRPLSHPERAGQGRGTVPAGHQQDSKGNVGGSSVNAVRYHHGGERLHASQSPARQSKGSHRTAALGKVPGGPGPGGDFGKRVDPHLALEGFGASGEEGGVS